jgi:quercetin dioxygenase-like cupin family protein
VVRTKFPDGYTVPPHWHPTDEAVTVLGGTLLVAMGEKMDESAMKELAQGSFALMPRKSPHYAKAKGETTLQIHGIGPFEITYINPQDDPRKKKTTS